MCLGVEPKDNQSLFTIIAERELRKVSVMNKFKQSVILMGIDWSKAANLQAVKDLSKEQPELTRVIHSLDEQFRQGKRVNGMCRNN